MDKSGTLEDFNLFCQFLVGERRLPDAPRWSFSIIGRAAGVLILYREALEQIPKCSSEWKEMIRKKYGSRTEALVLSLKYETFLNSIYSLCENLSFVVYNLYRSENLPRSFDDQRSRFLEDDSVDAAYSEILKETDWYNEVRAIRTEATHYLSGLIVLSGETTLGYFNVPKSLRKRPAVPITINDVEAHIKEVYHNFSRFLSLFGSHFVKIIDQDATSVLVCVSASDQVVGMRSIMLKEALRHEEWKCTGRDNCPERPLCKTRKRE